MSAAVDGSLPPDSQAPDDDEVVRGPWDVDRRLQLTAASAIKPRPVRWLWDAKVALGTLCLLAGREGVGKSTASATLAAQVTRGTLPGVYFGKPKSVFVVASEDSWAHTIVPRLMAAEADLDLIFRAEVSELDGLDSLLTLPADLALLEAAIAQKESALVLLDPLVSRLSPTLDSHKDSEVRRALEPLVAVADRSGASVLGLIHVNKSSAGDPLNLVMGSRGFSAVARSVLFAMVDPEHDDVRLLGQPKNNLGRSDLPTLTYRIKGVKVAEHEEGPIWTGALEWLADSPWSIADALAASGEHPDTRTATRDATEWLRDYLQTAGGGAPSGEIKAAAKEAGHAERTLTRARQQLRITPEPQGFPRVTYWLLPADGGK